MASKELEDNEQEQDNAEFTTRDSHLCNHDIEMNEVEQNVVCITIHVQLAANALSGGKHGIGESRARG